MAVAGIILCGGRSTRMGRPKAWLPHGGEVLLQRVVRIVGEVVSPVIVVAAAGQELPPLPAAVEVVFDEFPDRGPLQGLATGLAALVGRAEAAFVAAVDLPLLSVAVVRDIVERSGPDGITVPRVAGIPQPLAAVYSLEVLAEVQEQLAGNRLSLRNLMNRVRTNFLDGSFAELQDADTPAEYEAIGSEEWKRAAW